MKLLALIAAALLLPQEKNEAEELFKKMEEKIAKSKTVQLSYVGRMTPQDLDLSGTLFLGEGNRGRLEMEQKVNMLKKTLRKFFTSNGSKSVFVCESPEREVVRFNTPAALGKLIRGGFARAGFWDSIHSSDTETDAKADPETAFAVCGFKLGEKERVGEREAQAVEYTLARKGKKDCSVTVWIDGETGLPLKRKIEEEDSLLTETYSDLKIDEKIDAAKFELPKEK